MGIIKFMFCMLIFCVSIGAVCSIFTFIIDVVKWHDKEKRTKIKPSKKLSDMTDEELDELSDKIVEEAMKDLKDYTESEVSNVGDDVGKYNTSAFLGTGL